MNETKSLTAQEQKVYELVSKGLSNKAVGTELGITEKTVKFHLTKVYKKTGLTRYQLIAGLADTVVSQFTALDGITQDVAKDATNV